MEFAIGLIIGVFVCAALAPNPKEEHSPIIPGADYCHKDIKSFVVLVRSANIFRVRYCRKFSDEVLGDIHEMDRKDFEASFRIAKE